MVNQQNLSIHQLARLAKVSVRTLHYYDQIELLKPSRQKGNSYRVYDTASIVRLQQILFYKELGFELKNIKSILDLPGFDYFAALENHKLALLARAEQINRLVLTIEKTMEQMKGKITMTNNEYFTGFSDEQQAKYEKEADNQWGPEIVGESNRRWKSLSPKEREEFFKKGERITLSLKESLGENPSSPLVQTLVKEWQEYINFFYDCTPQILLGLGQMYVEDPRFRAFYEKVDPKLPEFFYEAIKVYCKGLGVIS
jgi:MerR family transcriptional regulator, thiopeptide resistance regulator